MRAASGGVRARRQRRGLIALCVALSSLSCSIAGQREDMAQGEAAERANQLYQEGEYVGAIEAYEAILDAGFESGDLHYNLGNAYFKSGDLGRSILSWERALIRAPGDPDVLANLSLASQLTVDAVDPLPRFWLLAVGSWVLALIPRGVLLTVVALAWIALTGGVIAQILARGSWATRVAPWLVVGGGVAFLVLGTNMVIREMGIGRIERAVILSEVVPVRSAPADDDDLTIFEVHEGTRVRIDQRTGSWVAVVLDDGKVGWIHIDVIAVI